MDTFDDLPLADKLAYIEASWHWAKACDEQSAAMEHLPILLAEIDRLRDWMLVALHGRASDTQPGLRFIDDWWVSKMIEDIEAALRGDPAPIPAVLDGKAPLPVIR